MKAKAYKVKCHCSNEYAECPSVATFEVDEKLAKEIGRLAQIVKDNDLHTVEKYCYRATWHWIDLDDFEGLEGADEKENLNTMRSECDILCISNDEFWFRCYQKHHDDLITTEGQSIVDLLKHFEIPG